MTEIITFRQFGEHIKELRKQKRLTQRELAAILEVDFSYISKIENGKIENVLSYNFLVSLANGLGVDCEELFDLVGYVDLIRHAHPLQRRIGFLVVQFLTPMNKHRKRRQGKKRRISMRDISRSDGFLTLDYLGKTLKEIDEDLKDYCHLLDYLELEDGGLLEIDQPSLLIYS